VTQMAASAFKTNQLERQRSLLSKLISRTLGVKVRIVSCILSLVVLNCMVSGLWLCRSALGLGMDDACQNLNSFCPQPGDKQSSNSGSGQDGASEENWELAWQFCTSNLDNRYHSYPDVREKEVVATYNRCSSPAL
jgi:hypothetical protein